MKFDFELNLDRHRDIARVSESNNFWLEAAKEWWKLLKPYTPMDTGILCETVNLSPKTIEYTSPYANYIYNGELYTDQNGRTWVRQYEKKPVNTHRPLHIKRNEHSEATSHWDIAAQQTQLPKLIETLQGHIDSGELNLRE